MTLQLTPEQVAFLQGPVSDEYRRGGARWLALRVPRARLHGGERPAFADGGVAVGAARE